MEGHTFINMVFQLAALNHFALYLEETGTEGNIATWPGDARNVYEYAQGVSEKPKALSHPEHGDVITHDFESEPGDKPIRMVCWAAMGPGKLNRVACDWWKEQGADPDKYVPGVTDLHRTEDDSDD